MKKNDFIFTIGLCIVAAVVWIVVEILMVLNDFSGKTITHWRVLMIILTCILSIMHGFKDFKKEYSSKKDKCKRK